MRHQGNDGVPHLQREVPVSQCYLALPIHGIATDDVDRRWSSKKLVRAFKKEAGLGRRDPARGSTFSIPAKEEGRFDRVLLYVGDGWDDLRGRRLSNSGRPIVRRGKRARPLVTFTDIPPKLLR